MSRGGGSIERSGPFWAAESNRRKGSAGGLKQAAQGRERERFCESLCDQVKEMPGRSNLNTAGAGGIVPPTRFRRTGSGKAWRISSGGRHEGAPCYKSRAGCGEDGPLPFSAPASSLLIRSTCTTAVSESWMTHTRSPEASANSDTLPTHVPPVRRDANGQKSTSRLSALCSRSFPRAAMRLFLQCCSLSTETPRQRPVGPFVRFCIFSNRNCS